MISISNQPMFQSEHHSCSFDSSEVAVASSGCQVGTLLTQRRFTQRGLLAEAALVGDVDTFDAVLNVLRARLTPEEVQKRVS